MPDKKLSFEHRATCALCEGTLIAVQHGLSDRLECEHRQFDVLKCQACGVGATQPMPQGDLRSLYPKLYFGENGQSWLGRLARWYRYDQYAYDFSILTRFTRKSLNLFDSYLDIGAGTGDRVRWMYGKGVKRCVGLEPYPTVQVAEMVKAEVLDYVPQIPFALVSMFHVLEHVPNPKAYLSHIHDHMLSDGGSMIIQVPNAGSFESNWFGKRWYGYDVPRHLFHFDIDSITYLLEKVGFEVAGVSQTNAWLHPVTLVPSLHRDLDIGRASVMRESTNSMYWLLMKFAWLILTGLTLPLSWLANIFGTGSMLTIVARK